MAKSFTARSPAPLLRSLVLAFSLGMIGIFHGCGDKKTGEYVPVQGKLKFLSLGDSYTIGEHVDERDCWPMQMAVLLRDKGLDVGDPAILARTGWTTDELTQAMDQYKPPPGYDLVSLQIGVNDEFRGYDFDGFKTHFKTLLDRSIALAAGRPNRVIVLSIPDWSVTPFGRDARRDNVTREIDQYNAFEKDLVTKAGAAWVNITDVSNQAGSDPSMVAGDGLHPSGKLYAQWVKLAEPAARAGGFETASRESVPPRWAPLQNLAARASVPLLRPLATQIVGPAAK